MRWCAEPSYSAEELAAMRLSHDATANQVRDLAITLT